MEQKWRGKLARRNRPALLVVTVTCNRSGNDICNRFHQNPRFTWKGVSGAIHSPQAQKGAVRACGHALTQFNKKRRGKQQTQERLRLINSTFFTPAAALVKGSLFLNWYLWQGVIQEVKRGGKNSSCKHLFLESAQVKQRCYGDENEDEYAASVRKPI